MLEAELVVEGELEVVPVGEDEQLEALPMREEELEAVPVSVGFGERRRGRRSRRLQYWLRGHARP